MVEIDLSGKVALVTGGSGQLGRVIVRTLARCGADVAIHYHANGDGATALAEEIRGMGRRAVAVQADVASLDSVMAMRDVVASDLGEPDIVVACAVIQYSWKAVLDQPVEDYESQFRSCVMHNVHLAKAFVPAMTRKQWGRYVGINTECILQCWPGQSAYVSGKQGMNGFLQTLAKEVGTSGVTVNQVAPGWMISDRYRVPQTDPEFDRSEKRYAKSLPLGHRGEDIDIANAVAFFASDLARFVTGAFLPVHGGGCVMPPWIAEG